MNFRNSEQVKSQDTDTKLRQDRQQYIQMY